MARFHEINKARQLKAAAEYIDLDSLNVTLYGWINEPSRKATIISLGMHGCAIRTTAPLKVNDDCLLAVFVGEHGALRYVRLHAEVIWAKSEFRIDTFYRYGLRFRESLSAEQLQFLKSFNNKVA